MKDTFLIRKGYLNGFFSGITWGLDIVLIGMVMSMMPFQDNPSLFVGSVLICAMLHDLFAACWMLVIMEIKGRLEDLPKALKTRDGMFCILGALFGGPLAMTFYILAIAKGGPALTGAVTACYPLLGALLATVILKERMNIMGWSGLLVCISGIAIIAYVPSEGQSLDTYGGIMFALVAAVGWAVEAVVCGYGMRSGRVSPQVALLIRELTSGIVLVSIVVPIILGGYPELITHISVVFNYPRIPGILCVTALVGMTSFLMWYTSINLIGASRALCLNVTYGFWSVVFSFVLTDNDLSLSIISGAVMIIAGVAVSTLDKKNTP